MARLDQIVEQHRRQLLLNEGRSAGRMIRAYGQAYQRINRDLQALATRIDRAQQAGEEISPAWLFQQGRLQSLKAQVEIQIARFAQYADSAITREQQTAVDLGRAHAADLMQAAMPPAPRAVQASVSWDRLPDDVFEDLVGRLSDGSPLADILNELPGAASRGVERALLESVASGINPVAAVKSVRSALGENLTRALTISRTEVVRSYRESSRREYLANSDVVQGWVWKAALGTRTCPACFAMNGTVHSLDETLDGHPNCRCVMVPQTVSWEDLGFRGIPDNRPTEKLGTDLFEEQPDSVKEAVLGKEAYARYQAGDVRLDQFVGQKDSEDWGTMRYTRSLKQIDADPEGDLAKPGSPSPAREDEARKGLHENP